MAQIVEPEVGNARFLDYALEHAVDTAIRHARFVAEDVDLIGVLATLGERFAQNPVYRDFSHPAAFGVFEDDDILSEVNVFPFEREYFPQAHSGVKRGNHDAPYRRRTGVKKPSDFFLREIAQSHIVFFQEFDASHGVRRRLGVFYRPVEGALEAGEFAVHRRGLSSVGVEAFAFVLFDEDRRYRLKALGAVEVSQKLLDESDIALIGFLVGFGIRQKVVEDFF